MLKLVRAQYVFMDFVCTNRQLQKIVATFVSGFSDTIKNKRHEYTIKLFDLPVYSEEVNYINTEKIPDLETQRIAKTQ